MYDVDLSSLPAEMLYHIADEYKIMALSCQEPRFLVKAKVIEALAGKQEIGVAAAAAGVAA